MPISQDSPKVYVLYADQSLTSGRARVTGTVNGPSRCYYHQQNASSLGQGAYGSSSHERAGPVLPREPEPRGDPRPQERLFPYSNFIFRELASFLAIRAW